MMRFERHNHINELRHKNTENPGSVKASDASFLDNVSVDDKPLWRSHIERAIDKMRRHAFKKTDITKHTRDDFELLFDLVRNHNADAEDFFEKNNNEIVKILVFYLIQTYGVMRERYDLTENETGQQMTTVNETVRKDICANYAFRFINDFDIYAKRFGDDFKREFYSFYPVEDKSEIAGCMMFFWRSEYDNTIFRQNYNWMDTSAVPDLSYFICRAYYKDMELDHKTVIRVNDHVSWKHIKFDISEWNVQNVMDMNNFVNCGYSYHSPDPEDCMDVDFSKWKINNACDIDSRNPWTKYIKPEHMMVQYKFNFNKGI